MHNGQVGGFERFRKAADMMIADQYYPSRRGSTDSEALFLVAMSAGLENDPKAALEQTVGQFETLSRQHGGAPHIRMTAAISDGQALYAVRYASDDQAPSLYFRKSIMGAGWTVVSEPYAECGDWERIENGTFLRFDQATVVQEAFVPKLPQAAQSYATA